MKKLMWLLAGLLLTVPAFADDVIGTTQQPTYLMAFSAEGGNLKDDVLTFESFSRVIYFSDRPARSAGHMSMADFIKLWSQDDGNTFLADPPNAVVSIAGQPDEAKVVVELKAPALKAGAISFAIRVIEGKLPEQFGECAVFVDGCIPGMLGVFSHLGG